MIKNLPSVRSCSGLTVSSAAMTSEDPVPGPAGLAESDGASSIAEWALPGPATLQEPVHAFKTKLLAELDGLMRSYGGPAQYLWQSLPSESDVAAFAKYLWEAYPEMDDQYYHHSEKIPPVSAADLGTTPPVCLHVSALGFDKACSFKPPPGRALFMQLLEQYLTDGFVSQGEPLMIVQSRGTGLPDNHCPWSSDGDNQGPLPCFSVGYLKGMARVTTLMCLLHYCWKSNIDLQVHHPMLYKSVLAIFVHHTQQSSKIDECLQNMKFSSRGSIRKMTNVIEITCMIKELMRHGLPEFGAFVRRWNQMSARSHQILGKRAMAIKLLFESAPEAVIIYHRLDWILL